MRCLVTGGAGFIGSFLSERLLAQGHEVICLDNFFTGRKRNIAPMLDNPRFEVVRHDVVEPTFDAIATGLREHGHPVEEMLWHNELINASRCSR